MSYPKAIEHYPRTMQIFIIRLFNRIESGKNCLVGVFGETGGGKSLSVLQIMRGLYLYRYGKEPEDDYILEHLFFKAKPFLENMKDLASHLRTTGKKKKQVWLFDEAGVDASNRNWQSLQNKILGWLAQTFRNLQQIIFFTTPSLSFLDSNVRKLLHFYLEAVYIDTKKKMCVLKPLEMQYATRLDKIYYHNLEYPTTNGIIEVDVLGCPKISDELEMKYDHKKAEFQDVTYGDMIGALNKLDDKHKPTLTERQQKIIEIIESGVTSTSKIGKIIGCASGTISTNFGYMRGKGVDIDELLKKSKELGITSEKGEHLT